MKILIGVDDSAHSNAAIEFVRRMTWPKDTKVLVLSAIRPMVGVYAEAYVPAEPYVEQMTDDLVKFHRETVSNAERTLRTAGIDTEGRILRGDPRTALIELARAEHADLVVVGSHGRTGMAKLVMGSVASHVVTHAPCSVMVVKLARAA